MTHNLGVCWVSVTPFLEQMIQRGGTRHPPASQSQPTIWRTAQNPCCQGCGEVPRRMVTEHR